MGHSTHGGKDRKQTRIAKQELKLIVSSESLILLKTLLAHDLIDFTFPKIAKQHSFATRHHRHS